MPPQPQQQQSPTFRESYAMAKWLMQFPALSVMVFFRHDLGYRLLDPFRVLGITIFLVFFGVLAQPGNESAEPIALFYFGGAFFILAVAQRIKRWLQFNRAVRQHSFYIGTSPFAFRWLPAFMRRNRRVARFVDPIFCALVGAACYPLSHALACWLFFSAFCLRAYEFMIHERDRNLDMDTIDGLINAENQGQTIEQFENVNQPRQHQQPTGIPTGLGDDVREHIRRRKTK
jgi:hypothetical protein